MGQFVQKAQHFSSNLVKGPFIESSYFYFLSNHIFLKWANPGTPASFSIIFVFSNTQQNVKNIHPVDRARIRTHILTVPSHNNYNQSSRSCFSYFYWAPQKEEKIHNFRSKELKDKNPLEKKPFWVTQKIQKQWFISVPLQIAGTCAGSK